MPDAAATSPPTFGATSVVGPGAPATRPARMRDEASPAERRPPFARRPIVGLAVLALVLIVLLVASLMIGSIGTISPRAIWRAIVDGRGSSPQAPIILDRRLPRTVVGLLAGIGLGAAGAVVQAVSRNPLADPGILGVAAGSSFAVAIAVSVFGVTSMLGYVWFALGGALVATVFVYVIGATGPGGLSPARLTLGGVALAAVLSGITRALTVSNPQRFSVMRAWQVGSIELRDRWDLVLPALGVVGIGALLALAITPALNVIALGDDHAASLGANVALTRTVAVIAVTLLAGGASALIGPLSFLGLMVPHVARWLVGPDQRWIIGYTLLLAPSILLLADIVARVVIGHTELPASMVTAVIGAPVLIYLVRRPLASGL